MTSDILRPIMRPLFKYEWIINMAKKPASQDWHRADIVAAFRKRNTTLARHSRQLGFTSTYLAQATGHAYPKAERLIADFLGVAPHSIWPSRYHADGTPRSGRGERGRGRHPSNLTRKQNSTPISTNGNVNTKHEDKQAA